MSRPKFFISSTIYDFKDLRSALKYYLEQQGAKVYASEYNDFPKPLDTHSYEACLEVLRDSDYFILLIGNRVGGWYDKENKISITRQEYKEAYKLHEAGKLKIISFVRDEIWDLKESHNELTKYLEKTVSNEKINEAIKTDITKNYANKLADDADFICDFIKEVGKNTETTQAAKLGITPPSGNWINQFKTFDEVISAINAQTIKGKPVEHSILESLLKKDLVSILKKICAKFKVVQKTLCLADYYFHVMSEYDLPDAITINEARTYAEIIHLKEGCFEALYFVSEYFIKFKINLHIIDKALASDIFFRFSKEENKMIELDVNKYLFRLKEEILLIDSEFLDELSLKIIKQKLCGVNLINRSDLLLMKSNMERIRNIYTICINIIKYIDTGEFNLNDSMLFAIRKIDHLNIIVTPSDDDIDSLVSAI